MREAARKTKNGILALLNLPASQDTQNAVTVLVETCWNNLDNVAGGRGDAHRGTFATAIIAIVRLNAGQTPNINMRHLADIADLMWADWQQWAKE